MNFFKTGPNSARTDLFEVKITKRDQLQYIEHNDITTVPIEIDTDRVVAIATSTIPSSKRQNIKQGVDKAMDFLSIPHRFDM